jgi:hypothetical protein
MSSRILALSVSLTLALGGCAVEHANNQPERTGAAGGQAPGVMPPRGSTPGPMHSVFSRVEDTVAVGVRRMTLGVMLVPETDRTAQRAALHAVLDAERRADTTFAAIRVLGFFPPAATPGGHPGGMSMVPSAILEWVPAGGWNAVSAANARGPHITDSLFVADLPNHQRMRGAGAAR